jgi:hypothetical protein
MSEIHTRTGLRRRTTLLLAAAAVAIPGVLLAIGDEDRPSQAPPPTLGSSSPAPALTRPASVRIERIGAESSLVALGKQPSGSMEVPDVRTPLQAGWYSLGVTPGAVGPAVIVGHVNGAGKPGIFNRLDELTDGDVVEVTRNDGRLLRFAVYRTEQVGKADFPTAEVYGDTDAPELRLITCSGAFTGGELGYADNLIVYLRQTAVGA